MVFDFFLGQNLNLNKAVNFSDHLLSSVTEAGNGLFGSRSSSGELYPSSDFKTIDREYTDLARMAENCLKFASPTQTSDVSLPGISLLWLPQAGVRLWKSFTEPGEINLGGCSLGPKACSPFYSPASHPSSGFRTKRSGSGVLPASFNQIEIAVKAL